MTPDTRQSVEDVDAAAKSIINKHTAAAAGVGLVPVPLIDLVGLGGIQINMLRLLAHNYDVEFRKDIGKSTIAALVGGLGPLSLMGPVGSLLKAVPLIGYTTSALSLSITGGALTYAIGCVFGQHFASGGNMLNFDPAAAREYFSQKYEEGKSVAGKAAK